MIILVKQNIILLFVIGLLSTTCYSQENRKDSQGRRHGEWKLYFEGTSHPKLEGTYDHGKETGIFKYYKKGFYDHPSAIVDHFNGTDSVQVTYYTQTGKAISKGKMLNKKREGKWIYFHQDSDSIMMIEFYKDDKLDGTQTTFLTNGDPAEKTIYKDGVKHGESILYSTNGTIAKHWNYKNGVLHGSVKYYDSQGELSLEGQYENGEKTGTWKYYTNGELEKEESY